MEQVARGVYWLPVSITNVYFVGERGGPWVLVDAGMPGSARKILRAAAELYGPGSRPEAILLTHGHFDHVGALPDLADVWGVPVYAHRMEAPYLLRLSQYPPPDPTVGGFMAQLSRVYPRDSVNLDDRLRMLEEGALPGMPGWEWIPTPGHTAGHVSFFRPEDRTLIAGDAFVTVNLDNPVDLVTRRQTVCRPPNYFTQDWEDARWSVDRLADLVPLVAATGHGVPMRGPRVAAELRMLADRFPVPAHGRYVGHPAIADEQGIVALPPPVPDPLPRWAAAAGLTALALAAVTVYSRRRGQA